MKKFGTIAVLIAFSLGACKKEQNATEMLMSHPWELEKRYVNGAEVTHPCQLDNVYSFNGGGAFLLQTGDIPCFLGESGTFDGTWELNPDNTRMNVIYTGNNITYDVITLSSGKLDVQYDMDTAVVREVYRSH